MSDIPENLSENPAIIKLIKYAKGKDVLSYDEVHDFIPDYLTNSDRIEDVIAILGKNNIKLEDEAENITVEEKKETE